MTQKLPHSIVQTLFKNAGPVPTNAKMYLVGGAVRDTLLGRREVCERDWVVVGTTPDAMKALGYKAVGDYFPVFLHPQTREEYALARLEQKTGPGHGGFTFSFTADTSLEDDLIRRDLTINAIASTLEGELIDPYNGLHDLKHRILRPVSSAFIEDPLRVLRVARFAAQLAYWKFRVDDSAWVMMQQMIERRELEHLSKERLWMEMYKALQQPQPDRFFSILIRLNAFHVLYPQTCERIKAGYPFCEFTITEVRSWIRCVRSHLKISVEDLAAARWCAALALCMRWLAKNTLTEVESAFRNDHQILRIPRVWQQTLQDVSRWLALPDSLNSERADFILHHLESMRVPQDEGRWQRWFSALDILRLAGHNTMPQEKITALFDIMQEVNGQELLDEGIARAQLRDVLHQRRLLKIRYLFAD
ncbi:MAG: hypothetical protein V4629_10535 [Pseudomonadota bacterium]